MVRIGVIEKINKSFYYYAKWLLYKVPFIYVTYIQYRQWNLETHRGELVKSSIHFDLFKHNAWFGLERQLTFLEVFHSCIKVKHQKLKGLHYGVNKDGNTADL